MLWLSETLLHAHLQEGINAIQARLDVIVAQNMAIIQNLRASIIQGAYISSQLSSVSGNAQMAAYYSRVNTYISQAAYLK